MTEGRPITAEELAAIKARADAATDGPWTCEPGGDESDVYSEASVPLGCSRTCVLIDARLRDSEFIAAARTDVPRLVAEVERLRAWIDHVGLFAAGRSRVLYCDQIVDMLESAMSGAEAPSQ
jgi:hypothetical protein